MERKSIALVMSVFIVFSLLSMIVLANELKSNTILETNESTIVFTVDQKNFKVGNNIIQTDVAPYIKDLPNGGGRMMVPVAFVSQALGTEPAKWLPNDQMVLITKGKKQIAIFIGKNEMLVNGKKVQMDVAAEIQDIEDGGGRTMLPIAFIAKALEVGYEWDGASRSVSFYGYTRTYDQKRTFGPVSGSELIEGSVVIKAYGVVLQNMIIKGNLIIAEEVGNGEVTLNNIIVKGQTYIRGGGKDSIHINGGQYNNITVQNVGGQVRIVATDARGAQVVVAEDAKGEEIILEGNFERVTVVAEGVIVTTQGQTTIKELIVEESAKKALVTFNIGTIVDKIIIERKVEVKGKGIIKEAEIKADGVSFEMEPWRQTGFEAVLLVPSSSSSDNGNAGETISTIVLVKSITINEGDQELIPDSKVSFTAKFTPDNPTNKRITWTSSDETIAKVDSMGIVTAITAGKTTITVKSDCGEFEDTCTVTVIEGEEDEINVPEKKIESISDIFSTIEIDTEYTLPTTVKAIMSDETENEVGIIWKGDFIDTSIARTYIFTGEVDGYEGTVILTLIVKETEKDITPPILSEINISEITAKLATLNFISDKSGIYYYLVYKTEEDAPDIDTIKAQGVGSAKGTGILTEGTNTISITNLTADIIYKIYLIVEYNVENISTIEIIEFITKRSSVTDIKIAVENDLVFAIDNNIKTITINDEIQRQTLLASNTIASMDGSLQTYEITDSSWNLLGRTIKIRKDYKFIITAEDGDSVDTYKFIVLRNIDTVTEKTNAPTSDITINNVENIINLSNTVKSIADLVALIKPSGIDPGIQTYLVIDREGTIRTDDSYNLTDGDEFIVTAANGINTRTYKIKFTL